MEWISLVVACVAVAFSWSAIRGEQVQRALILERARDFAVRLARARRRTERLERYILRSRIRAGLPVRRKDVLRVSRATGDFSEEFRRIIASYCREYRSWKAARKAMVRSVRRDWLR